MPILRNIGTLATCGDPEGAQEDVHTISGAAMAWKEDKIVWVGSEGNVPEDFRLWETWDAERRLVIPGLIDSHTHLAFGGWRPDEFRQRMSGVSYLDIARAGGGILRTVADTRAASKEQLVERSLGFLTEIGSLGVTTVECKSGYGLTLPDELKLLEVYDDLSEAQTLRIVPTFLGAHTLPPEFKQDRSGYLELLKGELIPAVADRYLAAFCDVFVDESAFTREEAPSLFEVAQRHGLRSKLHADQLSDSGGAELAAAVGAVSADHLEHASDEGIAAMAASGVVGVMLPIASLYLRQEPTDARKLIGAGVRVAIASDFNPGSAPSYHLPLAMVLACTLQGMMPAEALKAVTVHAARAVGLEDQIGSLEVGKSADFAVIDAPDVDYWMYHFKPNSCLKTVVRGTSLKGSD